MVRERKNGDQLRAWKRGKYPFSFIEGISSLLEAAITRQNLQNRGRGFSLSAEETATRFSAETLFLFCLRSSRSRPKKRPSKNSKRNGLAIVEEKKGEEMTAAWILLDSTEASNEVNTPGERREVATKSRWTVDGALTAKPDDRSSLAGLIDRELPARRCDKATHDAPLGKRGVGEGGEWGEWSRWTDLGDKKFRIQKGRKGGRRAEACRVGKFSACADKRGRGNWRKSSKTVCSSIRKYGENCKANRGVELKKKKKLFGESRSSVDWSSIFFFFSVYFQRRYQKYAYICDYVYIVVWYLKF